MKKIIIRTLGGQGIGYGHYFRCLSLAKAIKLVDGNIEVVFLVNENLIDQIKNTNFKFIVNNVLEEDINIIGNLDIDLFIFDSYLGSNNYLKNIKKKTKLMIIDDNNDIYDSSIPHIIYNGNIHAKKLGYKDIKGQLQLLGCKYLIMKEEYWERNLYNNCSDKDEFFQVLVTTGGTDEYKIALNILNAIKDLHIKIRVIIGPGYKDNYIKELESIKAKNIELIYKPSSLKQYIRCSKIVITAGGSTVYEVLSQKSIPIVFNIADNQDLLCKELQSLGVAYIGKYPKIDFINLKRLVNTLKNEIIDKYEKIFNLVDGKGAMIIAKTLLNY